MIEVKNVSKTYGKKRNIFTALDDVSFKIKEGSTLAIVGKSGSGKSTLMHIMSGLDHPTAGTIKIGKQQLSKLKTKQLDGFRANQMGFIFQAFFVEGNQTVYQNVVLPLEIVKIARSNRHAMAKEALESVGIAEKISSKAKNLSGGQKQRLAVARAIVNKPKLIFADEPTGNLDSATGKKVIDLLFNMNKKLGSTLIIVTHDNDLAARCEAKIELKDGKLIKPPKKIARRRKA